MKPLVIITTVTILFTCVLLIQTAKLQPSDRYQIGIDCLNKIGIERQVIDNAIAGDIPTHDKKYKDFLACSYKKQGFQDETGKMLIPNITQYLQEFYPSSDLKVLEECEQDGPDHGENAMQSLSCIINHLKKFKAVDEV